MRKHDCRTWLGFLCDEADGKKAPRLRAHLPDCPPCRAMLASLKRTVAVLRARPLGGAAPASLKAALRRRLRR
ncbi:MAG: hypothetical protein SF051_00390 [Elusimicrobiota bacterium]|nr:hypothetical protein [Elusimicrobiota bacterium]